MATTVFDVGKTFELGPGQTMKRTWNNAAPVNAVWSANAVPTPIGSTTEGFAQDTAFEITRLWRRLIIIEKSTNAFSDVDIEHEVHYEVKNVGSQKGKFRVFLCVTS